MENKILHETRQATNFIILPDSYKIKVKST